MGLCLGTYCRLIEFSSFEMPAVRSRAGPGRGVCRGETRFSACLRVPDSDFSLVRSL